MKNVLQQTNNLFRKASCMNQINPTAKPMQILWPLFIRYELIASVRWRLYLRRLIAGRSKFLLLNVTKQERGIQQINYVTEPGPRLVGVTRQAFQFWSLCPPLPLPPVLSHSYTSKDHWQWIRCTNTSHTHKSLFSEFTKERMCCVSIQLTVFKSQQ